MQYLVGIYSAEDFHPETGWSWSTTPQAIIPFSEEAQALKAFLEKQQELPTVTAINSAASMVTITNAEGKQLQDPVVYEGEDVFGWHAAYKVSIPVPGRAPRVDRFIDSISIHIGYYAFMKRYGSGPGIFVNAIADSPEEVQHLLGDNSKSYRVVS